MSTSINEFLLARITEDEEVARECLLMENLHPYGDKTIPAIAPPEWGDLARNYLGGPMGEQCARHDPTRTLAECAAKRAIIGLAVTSGALEEMNFNMGGINSMLLKPLAAIYSDHPDYQQEWAPDGAR